MLRTVIISIFLLLPACMTAGEHRAAVQDDSGDRVTVGTVQKEIKIGMSAAQVAEALGSPNIVTTDDERREVWIYDKISTNNIFSSGSGGVKALIIGGGLPGDALVGGGLGGNVQQSAGASSTSQRTLTIIIKFDKDKKVRDFSYRTSRF